MQGYRLLRARVIAKRNGRKERARHGRMIVKVSKRELSSTPRPAYHTALDRCGLTVVREGLSTLIGGLCDPASITRYGLS